MDGSDQPVRKRRGRPPGIPAWNKNKKMPDSQRQSLSKTMKSKWKDPVFREKRAGVFRRKEDAPWNKGASMSPDTCRKMSIAKIGTKHSEATRRKMSMSQSARPLPRHSEETMTRISESLRGKPKTVSHRRAIASAVRKRRAAARVLAAVEQVHRELSSAGGGPGREPSMSLSYDAAAKRNRSRSRAKGTPTRREVLNSYKSLLHEYRNLQAELQPWTEAFAEKTGRKPSLADVNNTGIEWLMTKYKQYILLREKLLLEIPVFREKVGAEGGALPGDLNSPAAVVSGTEDNANAMAKINAAREYRARQAEAAAGGSAGPAGAGNADPRVSAALKAASEYRKKRSLNLAAKSKAAADLARPGKSSLTSVSAALPWEGGEIETRKDETPAS